MPEPPKQSFFKGFFGGGAKQLDRNELFGESKASSSMAVVTQGDAMKSLTVRKIIQRMKMTFYSFRLNHGRLRSSRALPFALK